MTSSYPILKCDPKVPPGRNFDKWLLLPAHAWQVILVSSEDDRLDVFEKVIFNLMRSGDYDVGQLSEFTHLHPDLVMILLERLHEYRLIRKIDHGRFRYIRSAENAESAAEDSGDQTVGWIFQQPWTGRLFPAFYKRLPIQPTSGAAASRDGTKLAFGDESDPFEIWAQYLGFPRQTAINPTSRDVMRMIALRRSEEFRERLKGLYRIPRHEAREKADFPKHEAREKADYPKSVKRVKFLSTEPVRVYLASAGLVFDSDPAEWHVCCPVGTGLSQELRDQILRSSEEGDSCAEVIVRQLGEKTRHGSIYEWSNARRDYLALARRETLATFGPAIESYPDLLEQLDAFHDLWARLRGTEGEPPQHLLEPICSSARKTLESLVKVFASRRPIADLHAYLVSKDENENTSMVMTWLNQSGYDTGGIDGLFLVSRSWLMKSAGDSANYYMLKNVIGAIALQAKIEEDHPLRIAAETYPEFFADLRSLLALGNAASHDNSHGSGRNGKLSKEVALSIRQPLARIIRALLDPGGIIFKQDRTIP